MRRVGLVLFLWLSSATMALAADALTPADVKYLTALGQSQKDLAGHKPTPADLEKLHQVINDPALAGKPKAREDAVWRVLDRIEANFIWCADHPTDKGCSGEKVAGADGSP